MLCMFRISSTTQMFLFLILLFFRGPFQTTVDELTTGVLVRESDPLPEDITLSTEG